MLSHNWNPWNIGKCLRLLSSAVSAYFARAAGNRYAADWTAYSKNWNVRHGSQYSHLGDEWNDDRTAERKRDAFYFTAYAERWIHPGMTVLEVGPGGGKWTVQLSPKVRRLIALDVSDEMLKRTRLRCESLGLDNIDYNLANGRDFQPVADNTVDFFFSYDVFVHIALEDTWPYTQEMARVLVPGGRGICHYAINSIPEAWERIERNNDAYRGGRQTLGQFYYFSPETLRRMYEKCGLRILEQHLEGWHCTCVFEKPNLSPVPQLEALLKRLISQEANDDQLRGQIVSALRSLPVELERHIAPLLLQAEAERDLEKRCDYAVTIRRLWRGL
jgi:ubiquinone/menaquinone biosynthesis C-methylase UbiE